MWLSCSCALTSSAFSTCSICSARDESWRCLVPRPSTRLWLWESGTKATLHCAHTYLFCYVHVTDPLLCLFRQIKLLLSSFLLCMFFTGARAKGEGWSDQVPGQPKLLVRSLPPTMIHTALATLPGPHPASGCVKSRKGKWLEAEREPWNESNVAPFPALFDKCHNVFQALCNVSCLRYEMIWTISTNLDYKQQMLHKGLLVKC